jgi:choline kinase
VKAIIVAAGMGSRLEHLTTDLPKCLLEVGGKTLLQHQLDALRANGITDISIVKGYKEHLIDIPEIKYYINDDYRNNNILSSLMYASAEMNDDVVIAYSDILYDKSVVERLTQSKEDISIVVDIDWRDYYTGRTDHPIEEAENVIFDSDSKVVEIGKIVTNKNNVHGEFIGMLKLTRAGCKVFKENYQRARALFEGKPFQRARIFEKAYITDMLQELVVVEEEVHCVQIKKGWMEIDTVQDYERAAEIVTKQDLS